MADEDAIEYRELDKTIEFAPKGDEKRPRLNYPRPAKRKYTSNAQRVWNKEKPPPHRAPR